MAELTHLDFSFGQFPGRGDAGPSVPRPATGAGNKEMTRPSVGSLPVETENVGSKRKRAMTPEEWGNVRATRKKPPHHDLQEPTQVGIV